MKNIYYKVDVAVIGGGAAGMMAAGKAAESGAKVILLEKNDTLGKKLAITGKGRCNITQNESDVRALVSAYGNNGKFLFSAFSFFGPEQTMNFFESKGLKLKTERGGRVFPESDNAGDVIRVLRNYLRENGVEIILEAQNLMIDTTVDKKNIKKLRFKNGEVAAKNYIICTGGKSYPATGSTGEGHEWIKKIGHTVSDLTPALVPIKTREGWIKDLQGLSLKNVELSVWQNDKKVESRFGEMLFTHFGVSGPIVLDISKKVGELLKNGPVKLKLDLKPALDMEKLDQRVQRDFKEFQNKQFKNALGELLPIKMIPLFIKLSGINPEKQVNEITREERQKLAELLKGLEIEVKELMGFDLAVVTSGGVNLKEIDPKTMKSKVADNLYFAGEILDIDGPTGGYNLQVAWSTGYVAGNNAASR